MICELNVNNKLEQVQVVPLIGYNPSEIAKAIYETQATIEAIYNGVTLIDWDERLVSENELEVNIVTRLILICLTNKKVTYLHVFTATQEAFEFVLHEDRERLPIEFASENAIDNATIYATLFNSIISNLITHNSEVH